MVWFLQLILAASRHFCVTARERRAVGTALNQVRSTISKDFYKQPTKTKILAQNFTQMQSAPHTAAPGSSLKGDVAGCTRGSAPALLFPTAKAFPGKLPEREKGADTQHEKCKS